ncbi:MAG: ACT domain-containing protein [Patescibacteria group bacterium]
MENNTKLALSILPDKIGICHLDKNSPIPEWAQGESNFTSVTRTLNELSIILPQEKIPAGILAENDWRVFKVQGPLGFSLTGIVASLAKPLSDAEISIFYVSTYETDYLLVEDKNLAKAKEILGNFCEIKE